MFNVLPENIKQKIKSEYKLRRATVVFSLILALEISSLVLLFPSWLVSFYKEKDALAEQSAIISSSLAMSTQGVASKITETNTTLYTIDGLLSYPRLYPIVSTVISKKNSGIHLTQFSFTPTSATAASITLSGIASDRQTLVSFGKSLSDSGYFDTVDLPVSNLAADTNIDFSINLAISHE